MGSEEHKEMLFWTKEEYKKFSFEMMDKPVSFYAFEMLYWCGIREGELLALTAADFDFEKETVRINKSYQRLHGEDVITTPKTKKSNRIIKMPKFLCEEMREYAHGLCLLLVHHTRKQNADDKFDMISGTSGLLGAADGAFLLQKEKRTGNAATLEVSGRDQQDQKLYLIRNTETLLWDLQKAETELWKEPPEPLLDEIAELVMKDNPYWEGSPTALVALINVDIQPHVITRKLNVLAGRLYAEHGILFRSERVHEGRKLRLWKDNTENA